MARQVNPRGNPPVNQKHHRACRHVIQLVFQSRYFEESFMFKKLLAFFAAMSLVAAFAAVDVNKASEAELDGIKGIGPVTTKLIVSERKKGEFKNWEDFVTRVKGVGDKSAAKFSAEGLTVGGATYPGAAAAPAKADAKKTAKPVSEKAKDAAVGAKDAVKETAKDVKAAVLPKSDSKADAKADAKAEAKAKKEAKVAAKPEAKADAAKPAASAAK
jgi:competence protein ComEA